MEIEVKQANGVYVNAEVKSILPDKLMISYKNGYKPDEFVPYENCRIVKKKPDMNNPTQEAPNFEVDDVVEAYIKQANSDVSGWQQVKIKTIKVCVL